MTCEESEVMEFAKNFKTLDDLAKIFGIHRKVTESDEALQRRIDDSQKENHIATK